jgi:hypothetical protein
MIRKIFTDFPPFFDMAKDSDGQQRAATGGWQPASRASGEGRKEKTKVCGSA